MMQRHAPRCASMHNGRGIHRCMVRWNAIRGTTQQLSQRTAMPCPSRRRPLQVKAQYDGFSTDLIGLGFNNKARINDTMLQSLMELPGTDGMVELRNRAESLTQWKLALQRGTLPHAEDLYWPQDPFKTKFLEALKELEMPRFTRRYPAVLDTLMRQMLQLVHEFETKLMEQEQNRQEQQRKQQQKSQNPNSQQDQQDGEQDGDQDNEEGEGEGGGQGGEMGEMDMTDDMKEAMQEAMEQAGKQAEKLQLSLEEMKDGAGDEDEEQQDEEQEAMKAELDNIAEEIIDKFQQDMQGVMENLDRAQQAFEDLSDLMDGPEGFDLSKGTWKRDGWAELDELRKKLEDLKELRELVRSLGRGGGKGPLRLAPEELESSGYPPGVIRSPLQPEEVRGLTRSGELGRMLPSEMALLAHGWPRKTTTETVDEDGNVSSMEEEYYLPGAHAARMLHRVRRAERMLLSYERTGWLDNEPARVTGRMEIRPAAELGPIILCLDTSGSMRGARETVAKALALECMRGAHRQQRPCYLYAFSGPGEVQELELGSDMKSLDQLLDFLSCSFMGGTDVDYPLALSIDRLGKEEWSQADILMVTDGEISPPDERLLEKIKKANEDLGLEVHGLLVSSEISEPMKKLCTHLHVFKSWTAAGAANSYMY